MDVHTKNESNNHVRGAVLHILWREMLPFQKARFVLVKTLSKYGEKQGVMTNEDIIESVISVLAVDGDVNKWEMQFFNDVCNRLDVSKEARKVVLTKAKQGKGRIHLPTNEADKKRLLYFLVQAVVADGKVVPEERKILNAVVDKMGISKMNMERFLQMRLKEVKTETYTVQSNSSIVCPKCGNEQTTAYRCKRCGIIFNKYKQVRKSGDQEQSDIDKLKEILGSNNVIKGGTS